MKVLFLVSGVDEVSVRFRVLQYLPHLERCGVEAEVADLHTNLLERWRVLSRARGFDVVVVHRAFLSRVELALLLRAARRWLYDFDDAIMFRDSASVRRRSWQRRHRFGRMVRNADSVVAGNGYLAELARRYNSRVTVVPSVVDLGDYTKDVCGNDEPIIGWIGTRINLMYLHAIVPALRRVTERNPEVRIKIVCDSDLEVPGLPIVNKRWSRAEEAGDLASFRVGIMPLPNDPWARGKCAVKILQYFAASVPVVCSPVGTNVEVVEDGHNGYFARSETEWVKRIEELLNDAPTRARLARAGRATVEERYSVQAMLDRLLAVLSCGAEAK